MSTPALEPDDILVFWREAGLDRWFSKDGAFDTACRRFLSLHEQAASGALSAWQASPNGALALIILLDQLPRNMFRGTPRAWATDPAARAVAKLAVDAGYDAAVDPVLRRFFYLPFMHAEDLQSQDRSVELNDQFGDPDAAAFAHHHRDIVARFGRFPHRNIVLGRESTPGELDFLVENGFRG